MSQEFKSRCGRARKRIEELKGFTLETKNMVIEAGPGALEEVRKNVEIAFRHLEDARMRFGKALQALDGGVSVYDKPDRQFHQEPPVKANETGGESDANLDTDSDG